MSTCCRVARIGVVMIFILAVGSLVEARASTLADYTVEYKNDAGQSVYAVVQFTTYTPGDSDYYCFHLTLDEQELKHGESSNLLPFNDDLHNNEEVNATKVKNYWDGVYVPRGFSFVSDATTAGNCHSYAMGLGYWLWSTSNGSSRMLEQNYETSLLKAGAVMCDQDDWDHKHYGVTHTWKATEVFTEVVCGETKVKGVKEIREKSNSSPVYKKTWSVPYATDWEIFSPKTN